MQKDTALCIMGITSSGSRFRPSDWAERLAGVMSSYRPGGAAGGADAHISYSQWCEPNLIGNLKCIILHPDLKHHHPEAWEFVLDFASDNDLQVTEVCALTDER